MSLSSSLSPTSFLGSSPLGTVLNIIGKPLPSSSENTSVDQTKSIGVAVFTPMLSLDKPEPLSSDVRVMTPKHSGPSGNVFSNVIAIVADQLIKDASSFRSQSTSSCSSSSSLSSSSSSHSLSTDDTEDTSEDGEVVSLSNAEIHLSLLPQINELIDSISVIEANRKLSIGPKGIVPSGGIIGEALLNTGSYAEKNGWHRFGGIINTGGKLVEAFVRTRESASLEAVIQYVDSSTEKFNKSLRKYNKSLIRLNESSSKLLEYVNKNKDNLDNSVRILKELDNKYIIVAEGFDNWEMTYQDSPDKKLRIQECRANFWKVIETCKTTRDHIEGLFKVANEENNKLMLEVENGAERNTSGEDESKRS